RAWALAAAAPATCARSLHDAPPIWNRPRNRIHEPRGLRGTARFARAHDDHVDIRAEGADTVLEALALHLRRRRRVADLARPDTRSEEHTSEVQSRGNVV